jgi:3-methyladenine DNA glycosylase AlkD
MSCSTWCRHSGPSRCTSAGSAPPFLHPDAAPRLDRWAESDDFWVRRAALLSQIRPLRVGAGFERFAGYAEAILGEREFFIRKAIGWVLREVSKTRPDEVYRWLLPRASRASGVTMREAVKYLAPEQREALRAARADDQ